MKTTTNLLLKKIELTDSPPDITVQDANWDTIDKHLNTAVKFQKATGTGTAIILTEVTLEDGFQKTFIVTANNGGAATTINGKSLYKPGGNTAPTLMTGKAVTVWYDAAGGNFFIKASTEGDATAPNVLAGKKFSNDSDTGITGTMTDRGAVTITPGTADQVIAAGYHNGSGKVIGDTDLVSANIKAGVNIFGVAGNANVVDTSAGDAAAGDILSGKKAYVDGALVTGNIPSKAAATYTPGTTDQTIAASQYLSGAQTISGDTDLVSGNIKAGVNIFGVSGSPNVIDTTEATNPISAAQILSGKVGFVNGGKVTGSIPSKTAATIIPGTTDQAISSGQYLSGDQIIKGDANLLPANILSGKSIFGVSGSAIAGKRFASGPMSALTPLQQQNFYYGGSTSGQLTGSCIYIPNLNLGFTPRFIIVNFSNSSINYNVMYFRDNFMTAYPDYTCMTMDKLLYKHFSDPYNYVFIPAANLNNATWYAWE